MNLGVDKFPNLSFEYEYSFRIYIYMVTYGKSHFVRTISSGWPCYRRHSFCTTINQLQNMSVMCIVCVHVLQSHRFVSLIFDRQTTAHVCGQTETFAIHPFPMVIVYVCMSECGQLSRSDACNGPHRHTFIVCYYIQG